MDWERFNQLVALSEAGHGEDVLLGLRSLVDASETNEDNASVLLIIGACEKELGRYDVARKTLAEARSLAERNSWIHPRAIFFIASIDIRQGNWKRGLEQLNSIVKDFSSILDQPENRDLLEEVQRKRGMALYELDRPKEALPLLKEAVTREYEKPTSLYYLGRCYYDVGELARSTELLNKALALDLHLAYRPSAHYVVGLSYHWQGQNARAIPEFEWCLENDPQGSVAKWKVLTALVNSSTALGLEKDAERYSKMLRHVERHGDAQLQK
jgi:tetratricopeptide (TPR) repeat protein